MTLLQPPLPAGYRVVFRETVGSTNDEAKALARNGAAPETVVWALQQTQGRGRRGRIWSSPPGNLYASFILRPACTPEQAAQLGFVASLAIGDALAELAPAIGALACKWPNDVLLGGRKIAGILLESEFGQDERVAFVIVGLGVNLAAAPADTEFPATSIAGEGLSPPAPEAALGAVAKHFENWLRRWREKGFGPAREVWRSRAVTLGQQIRVRLETAILHGRFVDIDQHGALLLETGGELRRIPAGDVFPTASEA
jgi:BirA family transcriptional regulator, biotin operon repressor / biotin---[acetyl-CoA-carboxylase] ligase